jgi:hypothetical protein
MKFKNNHIVFLVAASLLFLMAASALAWSPADYTEFVFSPSEGENVVRVCTHSKWLGPDSKWPIATDSNDEWEAIVTAYDADGRIIGTIEVPQEADGKVDYNRYLEKRIKYIIVTQATGAESEKYFLPPETSQAFRKEIGDGGFGWWIEEPGGDGEPSHAADTPVSNTPGVSVQLQNSHEGENPAWREDNPSGDREPSPVTSIHLVFSKIEGEKHQLRAQCDNGQYGKDWWGIWDISSEGDWASKIYVLDADKNVFGKLTVPESALGILDFSGYEDAAYIQVEHPMCLGIHEIATGITIEGSLDDIIKEGEEESSTEPATSATNIEIATGHADNGATRSNYKMTITGIVIVVIIVFALLIFKKTRNRD